MQDRGLVAEYHDDHVTVVFAAEGNHAIIVTATDQADGAGYLPMGAVDGVFDSIREEVSAVITAFAEPGVHTICVRGGDSRGNAAVPRSASSSRSLIPQTGSSAAEAGST